MENWVYYIKFFTGLVAIVDPVGVVPVFLNLTYNQGVEERRRTGMVAAISTGIILIVAFFAGELLLRFFGISMASFRVAGGLLLLLMAISMMQARLSPVKQTREEAIDQAESGSVAVVPLAMPLLAGPGAISTVILYSREVVFLGQELILLLVIVMLAAVIWLAFRMSLLISDRLGRTGINIVTRIMGLIIASIGVEFIAAGLKDLLPALAAG